MAKKNSFTPVYPEGSIKEYRALLLKAIRKWQKEAAKLIKAALTQIRDDAISDLIARLRYLWDVQTAGLQDEISAMFERLNEKQKAWWINSLESATGMTATLFLSLMREHWFTDEHRTRVENNTLIVDAIGAAAILAIDSIIRAGFRSGIGTKAILMQIRPVFERMDKKAEYTARNEVEDHNAALNQQRQQEAEVNGYIWLETTSLHPRKHHLDRIGKHFLWSNPPSDGHPGTQPNCKCGAKPDFPQTVYGIPVINR